MNKKAFDNLNKVSINNVSFKIVLSAVTGCLKPSSDIIVVII